jgi:uncharacterized protein (DUF885 family)
MRQFLIVLLFSLSFVLSAEEETFSEIVEEHWQYQLKIDPLGATQRGIKRYNNLLPDASRDARQRHYEINKGYIERLDKVDPNQLSASDNVNYDLLRWVIEEAIAEFELGTYRIPVTTFSSFFTASIRTMSTATFNNEGDYYAYIERIGRLPTYFQQNINNMRLGLKDKFTQPRIVIEGIIPVVKAQVYDDPTNSALFKPFTQFPTSISQEKRTELISKAKEAISKNANGAFASLGRFLEKEYLPQTRDSFGAYQMDNGKAYYAHQIKRYVTSTDQTAEQIHDIGLSEVARIKREMLALIKELEFDGDFDAFVKFLRTDPQFYAKTENELLQHASFIAKRIDHRMSGFFGKLPRLPYGIEPVPSEIAPNYTTAAYWPATSGGNRGGTYVVNTYQLDQRPLYELVALTLHESVPGHHHQNALSQELEDVAKFRQRLYLSAFGEGWGLYSEKLGIEMDVYRTAYEHFGRLSYEMWRACRLVIDTGIHAKGWTRQQGIDFLANNTSLSLANVRAEVDRYISWPGQALSYKLGELKIWELRRQAQSVLKDDFDIREFHDAILQNGALPLELLEKQIQGFIQMKEAER